MIVERVVMNAVLALRIGSAVHRAWDLISPTRLNVHVRLNARLYDVMRIAMVLVREAT